MTVAAEGADAVTTATGTVAGECLDAGSDSSVSISNGSLPSRSPISNSKSKSSALSIGSGAASLSSPELAAEDETTEEAAAVLAR